MIKNMSIYLIWRLFIFFIFLTVSFFICAGCYYSSLLFLRLLRDWPTISKPRERIQEPQYGPVRPCFHPYAVLLLRRLAQGETMSSRFTTRKQIFFLLKELFPLCRSGSWSLIHLARTMMTLKPTSWLTETLRLPPQIYPLQTPKTSAHCRHLNSVSASCRCRCWL